MKVRLLTPADDLVALTEMLHRAYRELLEMGLLFKATHQDVETTRQRCSDGECWLMECDGRLVGTITLVEGRPDHDVLYYRRPGLAYFSQFGVDPLFRTQGVGRRLLRQVESRATEIGFKEIALDTSEDAHHLIELYQRHGYETVDTHQWGSANYRSVIMAKRMV